MLKAFHMACGTVLGLLIGLIITEYTGRSVAVTPAHPGLIVATCCLVGFGIAFVGVSE